MDKVRLSAAALVALGCLQACASDDEGECVRDPPRLGACVDGVSPGALVQSTGTITAVDSGGWDCASTFGMEPGARKFAMSDGTRVAMVLPLGVAPSLGVGDSVSIESHWQSSAWAPDEGALTIRGGDGDLLLWIASAASVSGLQAPAEITLHEGPVDCTAEDSCGTKELRGIEIAIGQQDEGVVPHGEVLSVGRYSVVNGGNGRYVSASGCADGNYVATKVAAVR